MQRRKFLSLSMLNLLAVGCGSATTLQTLGKRSQETKDLETLLTSGEVSADSLQFIREEEKLARDVYLTLYGKWQDNVFNNIASSEQKHTDAVRHLLEKYSIDDPAADTGIGEFENDMIQGLYNDLVERGFSNDLEALYVGAYIEEYDIIDLKHHIEMATSEDVKKVYTNLMEGSYNHLNAFVGKIAARGIDYEAQLMDQEIVENILSLDTTSKGSQGGSGKRRGR